MSNIQNKMVEIPFNQIDIPDEENARSDLKKIEELAASIREEGLLEPIGVVNGGEGDKPYRVSYGFRRAHALKLLKWGDKPVNCILVPNKGIGIKNLMENLHREDLPSVDLAQRLHDLETGEAPGSVGDKYTKKQLAEKLGMSLSHVTNLIRAHKNLGKTAKGLWRKHNLPTTLIFAWAKLSEEEQEAACARWEKDEAKRKEREKKLASGGDGGDGEGGEEPTKGKKGKDEDGPKPLVKGKNATLLQGKMDVLQWKVDQGIVKGTEAKEALAQVQLIRFVLGDIARFPSVSKAEEKEYNKWLKEQEPVEEVETTEEEGEE